MICVLNLCAESRLRFKMQLGRTVQVPLVQGVLLGAPDFFLLALELSKAQQELGLRAVRMFQGKLVKFHAIFKGRFFQQTQRRTGPSLLRRC